MCIFTIKNEDKFFPKHSAEQLMKYCEFAYKARLDDIKQLEKDGFIEKDEKLQLIKELTPLKGTGNLLLGWLNNPSNVIKVIKDAGIEPEDLKMGQADLQFVAYELCNIVFMDDDKKKLLLKRATDAFKSETK